ncbi:MAG: bacterial Ig-like domain-containing protein, partial [Eubacterium sp.]
MNTLVNDKVVNSLFNEKNFNAELKAMLHRMLDEELEKEPDDMDCDLIDECTNMLIELEQEEDDGFAVLIPLINSEKIMRACGRTNFKSLSRGMRASLIACIILLSAFTANTAIAKIFNFNIAQEVVSSISQKLEDWGIIASADESDEKIVNEVPTTAAPDNININNNDEDDAQTEETTVNVTETAKTATATSKSVMTTTAAQPVIKSVSVEIEEDAKPVAIRLTFTNDFKTEYLWGENLNTNGLTVTAVYDGGATEIVSTDECSFTGYNKALEGTQKIVVTYEGVSATFEITLKKTTQKAERTVTGVQGNAPTKLVYTTDDTKIDLAGFRAKLIYSDGSYSDWYYGSDVKIITVVDFSQIGEQTVTVRIADMINYDFSIAVIAPEAVTKDIRAIDFKTTRFYVGEEPDDFYITVYYNNAPSQRVYYSDEDSFTILGLDTSIETLGTSKSFTVIYNGYIASQRYTVVSRNLVLDADIVSADYYTKELPKLLYYYGEELGLGKGINSAQIIPNLVSSQLIDGQYNFGTNSGYNWKIKVHFSDTSSNTSFSYLYPGELDF